MGRNRRFAQQVATSDEEEEPRRRRRNWSGKKVEVEVDEDEDGDGEETMYKKKKMYKRQNPEPETSSEEENEEQEDVEALPVGSPVRYSGKGRGRTTHYHSFDYDGIQYHLDITSRKEGSLMVTGQWFYRPEEAEKKTGGNWQSQDTRELFYSFHRDDVPAESVMHKCVVHFIPRNKQIPNRKEHPGFIVQKVYDTDQRKLFKLTDKDYEDNKQHEIDLLVEKTFARLGDMPDIEQEDVNMDQDDQIKNKRLLRKKNVPPLDVSREDEGTGKSQLLKAETPGSTPAGASEFYSILSNFKMLTGETQRDKWLEKLLQSIQFTWKQYNGEQQGGSNYRNELPNKEGVSFDWPDAAVPAVAALEKAAHDTLAADFQKYNQKMRQLFYNLRNAVLARRLLNKELEPAQILNMSFIELKEGLTAEEIARGQPEETGHMQMTDARCVRCSEKKVGLIDIIQAGHGDRYKLECVACGNIWYASRDDASTLTIEGPNLGKTTGVAPLGTTDAEKILVRGDGDGTIDVVKVLEDQRSFNNTQPEENGKAK